MGEASAEGYKRVHWGRGPWPAVRGARVVGRVSRSCQVSANVLACGSVWMCFKPISRGLRAVDRRLRTVRRGWMCFKPISCGLRGSMVSIRKPTYRGQSVVGFETVRLDVE